MSEEIVVQAWYEAPLTRSAAKNPSVTPAVKTRLADALAAVGDSKPISRSDLANLAADLLKVQEHKTPTAG